MENKVFLILVDGMRPDSMEPCAHLYVKELLALAASALDAVTVMPSVTLPCHMSLFHSVDPARHGVTTNTYTPQVRPVTGLCEHLRHGGKTIGFFYDWEELRDLCRPGSLSDSVLLSGDRYGYENTCWKTTEAAVAAARDNALDFIFLYIGLLDAVGHDKGWMGEEYLASVHKAWDCIEAAVKALPACYSVIVTADHGGHSRGHGTDCEEDMRIPLLCKGPDFTPGSRLANAGILDIGPTIAVLLGVSPAPDWEGHSLV